MKDRRLTIFALVAGAVVVGLLMTGAPSAVADSIGGSGNINCPKNDCFGTLYTLQYNPVPDSTTATTQTFDITLTLDTSSTSGVGPLLPSVAIKVASSATGAIESAPAILGGWTEVDGGLNSGGCDGSGSGFICAQANTFANAPTVPDGVYVWVFDVTIPTGTLFTLTDEASIKAIYGSIGKKDFKNNGITSEDITLQPSAPEASAVTLTSLVLLAFGTLLIRSRRNGLA